MEFVGLLSKASYELAIMLKDPYYNVISYTESDKDYQSQKRTWI